VFDVLSDGAFHGSGILPEQLSQSEYVICRAGSH
jgi:hypothetical protein